MNSWSNAIILSIILVAGAWLLVVNSYESPKPPAPAVQPVEQQPVEQQPVDSSFWQDARGAIAVIGRSPEVMMILSKAFADASNTLKRAAPVSKTLKWTPDEQQVILYFYDSPQPHTDARQLIQQGHTVYRAGPHREDLLTQFDARAPLWLVIRDGDVIYRSMSPPRFPSTEPVRRAPVYQAPVYQAPAYRGGFSCVGGICQ